MVNYQEIRHTSHWQWSELTDIGPLFSHGMERDEKIISLAY